MKPLFLAIFIKLFFLGCSSQTTTNTVENQTASTVSTSKGVTEIGNFEYWHHRKNPGVKPYPGTFITYHYKLTQGDQVLANTFEGQPAGTIFPSDEDARNNPQALIEGLRLMATGDSLTIKFPTNNIIYNYELVLVNVIERK